jgi:hypothetical protein
MKFLKVICMSLIAFFIMIQNASAQSPTTTSVAKEGKTKVAKPKKVKSADDSIAANPKQSADNNGGVVKEKRTRKPKKEATSEAAEPQAAADVASTPKKTRKRLRF